MLNDMPLHFLPSGYVPAVIFLAFIILILIGLLATYYCLKKELCPCSKMEPPQKNMGAGYEELGEEPADTSEEEENPEDQKDGAPAGDQSPEKLPIFEADKGDHVQKSLSAYGDIQVDTGLKEVDHVPVFGSVHFQAEYSAKVGRVAVTILEARELPSKSRGGSSHCRFHLVLLPSRRQRYKSKSRPTSRPKFDEKFVFDRILQQDLFRMALRIRLYGRDKLGKEKIIGEHILQLADVAQSREMKMDVWRDLKANLTGTDTS